MAKVWAPERGLETGGEIEEATFDIRAVILHHAGDAAPVAEHHFGPAGPSWSGEVREAVPDVQGFSQAG